MLYAICYPTQRYHLMLTLLHTFVVEPKIGILNNAQLLKAPREDIRFFVDSMMSTAVRRHDVHYIQHYYSNSTALQLRMHLSVWLLNMHKVKFVQRSGIHDECTINCMSPKCGRDATLDWKDPEP